MIGKILSNKKYKDYYNFSSWECKAAVSITGIIFLLLINSKVDIYSNFEQYKLVIQNIVIYVAAGLLAMIGVILTAIAFILGILDKKFRDAINMSSKVDVVKSIMLSFEFLVLNLGICSIYLFVVYFFTEVKIYIRMWIFYLVLFISIYYILFLIFYTIALISNTIEIYFIKDLYEQAELKEKTIYDRANEIRIDYLIKTIGVCSSEDLIRDLQDIIESMNISNKKELKEYIRNYYS